MIVKRTAGYTENQSSWPRADWISGNIECTITEARCYSSNLPQGGLKVASYLVHFAFLSGTFHFSSDAKLGRSYKLSASKLLIMKEFNLTEALSTVNSSNIILRQIFLLYSNYMHDSIYASLYISF